MPANNRKFESSTLGNWKFQEGYKKKSRPMRASIWPLFVPLEDVLKGIFHLRQISKIKQYHAIDEKYVRRRVRFNGKKYQVTKGAHGQKNCTKRDADDDKKRRWWWTSASKVLIHLYGISCGFAETYVEYVQSTCEVCAKWKQGSGPRSPGGGLIIELSSKCSWYIIKNYSKIQKKSFL